MKRKNNPLLERADYTWSEDSVRLINTPTQTARQSFFHVQEVGCFKTYPPYFTERANLNSFLIFCTLSGKGRLKYMGQTWHLLPGTAVLINCMNHHYYECLSGQSWEFLWLHFNGPAALGYYEEFVKSGFRVIREEDPLFLEDSLRSILSLTQNKSLHSEILISDLITRILTRLLIENSRETAGEVLMPVYVTRVLQSIDRHFQEPLSLDIFAADAGISKYHLSREFKRCMGVPVNEYLISVRLTHAKELLRYSTLPVEQVAYACGFHSAGHFINMFRKREQTTPLQYRREWGK